MEDTIVEINLIEDEIMLLDSNFFIVKKGEIIVRYIFEDGKILNFEFPLRAGEVNGNFFNLFPEDSPFYNEVTLEIQATQESVIEVFELNSNKKDFEIFNKIILQLAKQLVIKSWFQLYSKENFILLILRIYTQKYNKLLKKYVKHEIFNISRSQFYLLYSKLKKQKNIIEKLGYIKVC